MSLVVARICFVGVELRAGLCADWLLPRPRRPIRGRAACRPRSSPGLPHKRCANQRTGKQIGIPIHGRR